MLTLVKTSYFIKPFDFLAVKIANKMIEVVFNNKQKQK